MTRRAGIPDHHLRTVPRRAAGLVRWLLALFLLSLAAPVVDAVAARAAVTDGFLVELCTADGVTQVTLDRAGHPIDGDAPGHHAAHDCTACLAACGKHLTPIGLSPPLRPMAGFCAGLVHADDTVARVVGPAARTPLPPRGPPKVS